MSEINYLTEVVFYTKVLVNDILVGSKRILDCAGVGFEKFDCISITLLLSNTIMHMVCFECIISCS